MTQQEDQVCRICYEVESETQQLISPCYCTGSVRYVHEECLKIWLSTTGDDLLDSKCELCQVEFDMEIKVKKKCTPRKCLKEGIGHCIFTPLLVCVIGMLVLIIYIIIIRYNDGETEEQGYAIALLISCVIGIVVIASLMVNSLKEVCTDSQIGVWKISNKVKPNERKDSPNITTVNLKIDEDDFNHDDEDITDNAVFIIPNQLQINGSNVRTPNFTPPFLSPIYRKDRIVAFKNNFVFSALPSLSASAVRSIRASYNNISELRQDTFRQSHDIFPIHKKVKNKKTEFDFSGNISDKTDPKVTPMKNQLKSCFLLSFNMKIFIKEKILISRDKTRRNSIKYTCMTRGDLAKLEHQDPAKLIKIYLKLPLNQRLPDYTDKVVEIVKGYQFFKDLSVEHGLNIVFDCCQYLKYEKYEQGSQIFKQGDPGDKFYIILHGQVAVVKINANTEENEIILQLKEGQTFGEGALMNQRPRAAGIICQTKCKLAVLQAYDYLRILDKVIRQNFNEQVNLLRQQPIFKNWTWGLLQKLTYFFFDKELHRNQIVFKQGDAPNYVYIIKQGRLQLQKQMMCQQQQNQQHQLSPKKLAQKQVSLTELSQGVMFGEDEVYRQINRQATCVCVSNYAKIYCIDQKNFLQALRADKEASSKLGAFCVIKDRLRRRQFKNRINIEEILQKNIKANKTTIIQKQVEQPLRLHRKTLSNDSQSIQHSLKNIKKQPSLSLFSIAQKKYLKPRLPLGRKETAKTPVNYHVQNLKKTQSKPIFSTFSDITKSRSTSYKRVRFISRNSSFQT